MAPRVGVFLNSEMPRESTEMGKQTAEKTRLQAELEQKAVSPCSASAGNVPPGTGLCPAQHVSWDTKAPGVF